MNHALQLSTTVLRQLWNGAYPYLVIGRIALLVLASLAFLHFDRKLKKLSYLRPRRSSETSEVSPESCY